MRHIGILVLIDHDISELIPVEFPDIRIILKELYHIDKDIVKIHRIIGKKLLLISLIDLGNYPVIVFLARGQRIFFDIDKFVLSVGDLVLNSLRLKLTVRDIELLHGILDELELVIGIDYREILRISEQFSVTPQQPGENTVKRSAPDIFRPLTDKSFDPLPHLIGSLVRKCDRQNRRRGNIVLLHHIGDPVCDDPGLA